MYVAASPAYIDVRVKLGMVLLPAQKETRRRRKEKKVHQSQEAQGAIVPLGECSRYGA